MQMTKLLSFIVTFIFILPFFLGSSTVILGKPLKAAFIYFDSVEDGGWSRSHEKGRQVIERLPDVETTFIENVKESFYTSTVLRFLASNNYKLIFATSLMQVKGTLEVADKYPDTIFMLCSDMEKRQNVGNYFGKMYEARYLTGIVAGLKTKSNKIGYVAAFKVPEVIRGINGFILGVKAVNPTAKVHVKWTNQWNGEKRIVQATNHLIDLGVDIIAQHQDSPTALLEAQKRDVYTIGYHDDSTEMNPDLHLISAIWDWSKLYKEVVKEVQSGQWKSQSLWWGLKEGAVKLSSYGNPVSNSIQQEVEKRKQLIMDGYQIFQGPIKDSTGNIKVSLGKEMSKQDLREIDWLVEGVIEENI